MPAALPSALRPADHRAEVAHRQIQRERAADAGGAAQLDLAPEEVGQLAADGQPQAGAAELAAGAGVGLLERLEDDALLLGRDADARIRHLEGDDAALAQHRVAGGPAAGRRRDGEPHAAVRGELEGVREQVLQHLLQPLGVGDEAASQPRVDLHVEGQGAALRLVPEGTADHVEQVGEVDLLGLHRHGARFDLRQVEDVGDQVQQVGAGAVDRPREFHLLRARGCHRGCRRAAVPG